MGKRTLLNVTSGDKVPLEVNERRYWTATEVISEVGITRQTLWRWRQDGHVPKGTRYREKTVVFTHDELEAIRSYSNRMAPIESARRS